MELPRLSASKLKVYQHCPKKYWYDYIKKYPKGPRHPSALIGSSFHKAVEQFHKPEDTRDPMTVFTEEYKKACEEEGAEFDQLLWSDGVHMCLLYMDVIRQPVKMEREFFLDYPLENPRYTIHGYIDQLYDWGVVDLKTNKKRPTQKELDEDLQFIIYAWAFEQIQGYPPEKVIWYQARTGKDIVANVVGKMDRVDSMIAKIDESYFMDEYPRNEGFMCRFCPFKGPCLGVPIGGNDVKQQFDSTIDPEVY